MQKFNELYQFLEFAKNNRKYTESVANNLKSSIKVFESVLNEDEHNSIDLVKERIEEIFISVVNVNKDKNISSLNTYKARLQRLLEDYKKYGEDPGKIQNWKSQHLTKKQNNSQQSTPLLNKKDNQDNNSDNMLSKLSYSTHNPVNNIHRLELFLPSSKEKFTLLIPNTITPSDAQIIKSIIDSLAKKLDK